MRSHPSVDRQSPFLRPCCTLVRRAGPFVPSRSRHSREAFTQGRLRPPFFFARIRREVVARCSITRRTERLIGLSICSRTGIPLAQNSRTSLGPPEPGGHVPSGRRRRSRSTDIGGSSRAVRDYFQRLCVPRAVLPGRHGARIVVGRSKSNGFTCPLARSSRETEIVRDNISKLDVGEREAVPGAGRDDDVRCLLRGVRQHVSYVGKNTALEQDEIMVGRRAGLEVDYQARAEIRFEDEEVV